MLAADGFSSGTASMCRAVAAEIDLMTANIKGGADPLKTLQDAKQWLALVLYSCNSNNFNK